MTSRSKSTFTATVIAVAALVGASRARLGPS